MLLEIVLSGYYAPTGDLPVPEDSGLSKDNRGCEPSLVPAAVMGDMNAHAHHLCPSLQRSCTFTSFKPTTIAIATSPDSTENREGDTAGPSTLQKVTCG